MRRIPKVFVGSLLLLACTGSDTDPATDADTLTRAQRDSIIGASPLPGAAGVRRALEAQDAAADRAAALDSIR
ncbi:MAG: hypothetical protein ACRELD_15090 [Longimicrobiales bacterium]